MTTNNWESKIKEGKESISYYEETGIKEISTALGLASWHVNTDKLESFISSLLESQKQQLIEEIRGEIENEHDDCSCQTHILSLKSLQVNKDL